MIPDNAGYYHAAYIAAVAIYLFYGISIAVRTRRTRTRLDDATRDLDRT